MRQKFVKYNGITLISLVITISVLLILVGVTLNMLMAESGIFSKVKTAKEKTEIEQDLEYIKLKIFESKLDNLEEDDLKKIFKNDADVQVISKENENLIIKNGKIYKQDLNQQLYYDGKYEGPEIFTPIELEGDGTGKTMKIEAKTNSVFGIKEYRYYLNNNYLDTTTEENYIVSELEPYVEYSVYVIAVDNNENEMKSNELKLKTGEYLFEKRKRIYRSYWWMGRKIFNGWKNISTG